MYLAGITFCFILFDLITGIIKAFKEKNFMSSVMREGLFHKSASILCVVFGFGVDKAQEVIDLGVEVPAGSAICGYIILMEIGSIIENIGAINPDIVPKKLKSFFKKL